jgi:hypothetical protein
MMTEIYVGCHRLAEFRFLQKRMTVLLQMQYNTSVSTLYVLSGRCNLLSLHYFRKKDTFLQMFYPLAAVLLVRQGP